MKSWKEIEKEYPKYLKRLKTDRRLSSFNHVIRFIKEKHPEIYSGTDSLNKFGKNEMKSLYETWKGKILNAGETQVFNDLYREYFSK